MNSEQNKKNRKMQILEAFAHMLEASPGARITTAALARQVGVSEAALYRHFPSKTKMFEGLIEFIEDSIFARSNKIGNDPDLPAFEKCKNILTLLLVFSEKNPGISRILTGDALAGETDRLHLRTVKIFERLDTQLKQIIRSAELTENIKLQLAIATTTNLWLATAEGRISQFVRSHFKALPTSDWEAQWSCLANGVLANNLEIKAETFNPA